MSRLNPLSDNFKPFPCLKKTHMFQHKQVPTRGKKKKEEKSPQKWHLRLGWAKNLCSLSLSGLITDVSCSAPVLRLRWVFRLWMRKWLTVVSYVPLRSTGGNESVWLSVLKCRQQEEETRSVFQAELPLIRHMDWWWLNGDGGGVCERERETGENRVRKEGCVF